MNLFRKSSIFSAVVAIAMTTSAWAANDEQHDSHHLAPTPSEQMTQATSPSGQGVGGMATMPGYTEQMKAMQGMHDKMLAAKTPEERNALMTEHMNLMQNGMGMMGQMRGGAMASKPSDMAACQGMMDPRMEMMQSMMQMMMDRMPPAPAMK